MKYIGLIFCILFIGCGDIREQNNDIYYWKDNRTNLCFASFSCKICNNYSITIVPCDSLVIKQLVNKE